jgi:hypothetical protein
VVRPGQRYNRFVPLTELASQALHGHVHLEQHAALSLVADHALNPKEAGHALARRHGRHVVEARGGIEDQIAGSELHYAGPLNFIVTQRADGEVDNRAAYVFDRLQLTERFEINAGLRYEHNDASSTLANIAAPYPAPPAEPVVTQAPLAENIDDLASYRIG